VAEALSHNGADWALYNPLLTDLAARKAVGEGHAKQMARDLLEQLGPAEQAWVLDAIRYGHRSTPGTSCPAAASGAWRRYSRERHDR
jgi:hypothetical protein